MKLKTTFTALLIILGSVLMQPVAAGELLIGAKAGLLDPEFDDIDQDDPFAAVTLGIGYEFLDLIAADIGAEVEFTRSLTDGELANNDYSYESIGLIFSLRTAGPIYFVGRAGALTQEFDFANSAIENHEDEATVLGAGIGFSTGVRWEIQLDAHSYRNSDNVQGGDGSAYYLNVGLSF